MVRILALSDFSANAHRALGVAMRLAQQYGGEVVFAHAMAPSPIPAAAPQELFSELLIIDQAKWQEKLREQVQQLFQELGIRHKEVLYQVKVVPSPFVEAAVQLSEQSSVDLVLVGSTGTSGLQRIIMGSNTLQLVKRTTKPLLVIPGGFIFGGFSNITLVIRPERFRYKQGISILQRMARSYGAVLHFLFVLDDDSEEPELEDFLTRHHLWQEVKDFPCKAYSIPGADKIKALQEHIEVNKTDLLVVFPSSRSIWEELFSSSITEEMADKGKTPLLVFPLSEQQKHQGL